MVTTDFDIGRYRRGDRQALLDFRAVQYGEGSVQANPAYVDWLYGDPPDPPGKLAPLFVCRSGGAIVGTQGHIQVGLKVDAELLAAAWTIDFAVRADMRRGQSRGGFAVGSSIADVSRKEINIRLAMHVSLASMSIMRRLGWVSLCEVPLWVRPLDVATLLRARGASPALLALARAAQIALDALHGHAARQARSHGIALVPTTRFDERADQIWASSSPGYPVVCRRDHAYVTWRFDRFYRPDGYARFWLRQGMADVGYAVLRFGMNRGAYAGVLVDYFCPPSHAPSLFARCLEAVRDAGGVALYCAHLRPGAARLLRPLGFLRRSSGWPVMVYATGVSQSTYTTMTEPSNWFVTAGDSNVDHLSTV